jgi:hypothetical protein
LRTRIHLLQTVINNPDKFLYIIWLENTATLFGDGSGINGSAEKCLQNSGRKYQEKRPLGRRKSRWQNNITKGLKEIACVGVHWISGSG